MKKHARILTAILSVILTVTAFSVTVHAEDIPGGDPGVVDPQPQDSYVEPQPQDSYVEPQPQESYVEPQPQDSYVEPDPQYSYVEPDPQTSYVEPYEEPDYSNNSDVYYDADGNTYSDYSEVYVGGDQTYTPPMSTAPSAPLFDTSKTKVDEKTLSSSDWNDIKAKLSGASGTSDDNGGDFAFIQNNDAAGDNGHLILILGFTLIALSVAGFAYLISSAVARRKKTALAHAGKSAAHSANGARYRSNADYDDDFGGSSKRKPKNGRRYK